MGFSPCCPFKALAEETGIPYQNLINLYLRECAHAGKLVPFSDAQGKLRAKSKESPP